MTINCILYDSKYKEFCVRDMRDLPRRWAEVTDTTVTNGGLSACAFSEMLHFRVILLRISYLIILSQKTTMLQNGQKWLNDLF